MKFKLAFHPLAKVDLVEAAVWHDFQESGLAKRFEGDARERFRDLGRYALLYAVRFHDIRRVNLRVFRYGVFYFIRDETVVVLGVLHAARDSELELKRRRKAYHV